MERAVNCHYECLFAGAFVALYAELRIVRVDKDSVTLTTVLCVLRTRVR